QMPTSPVTRGKLSAPSCSLNFTRRANCFELAGSSEKRCCRPTKTFAGLLTDRVSKRLDFRADVCSQSLESQDGCERYQRCGNCVFGKFQTGFITEESLNHFVAPFRFD